MKFLKILSCCLGLYFLCYFSENKGAFINESQYESSISSSFQNINRNNNRLSNDYKISISFDDNSDKYTHVINNGTRSVHVKVHGHPAYLKQGEMSLVSGKMNCRISGEGFTGSVGIKGKMAFIGTVSEREAKKKFKNKIIQGIINEIKNK